MSPVLSEPFADYFLALKIGFPSFIHDTLVPRIFDEGRVDHVGAGLVREGTEWRIYMNVFHVFPRKTLQEMVADMNAGLLKNGVEPSAELVGGAIKRGVSGLMNGLLNTLADTKGVVILPVALLGTDDILFGFKYCEASSERVSSSVLGYLESVGYPAEIVLLTKNSPADEPPFIRFHRLVKFDFSRLSFIRSTWRMGEEELAEEADGIFENRMGFQPKYVDSQSAPVYAEVAGNELSAIMGRGAYQLLGQSPSGRIVEFAPKSSWFNDFYTYVVQRIRGPFYYTGTTDGKGFHENFFVVGRHVQKEFLLGLKDHWKKQVRAGHRNTITHIAMAA